MTSIDEPRSRDLPPEGVFEIGFCLAGAVSAGAYTAGVLDMLVEALDTFSRERARRIATAEPRLHEVRVPVFGGASAGGICAAIVGLFVDKQFPAIRPETPAAARRDNPFWRAWVEDVDIRRLLEAKDIQAAAPLASLLDCTVLDETVDTLLDLRPGLATADRPWVENPLRVVLTLSNLNGVPYALRFEGQESFRHWMSLHADHVRYAVALDTTPRSPPATARLASETALDRAAAPGSAGRDAFKANVLGTSAFPVALAPRVLQRPREDYTFRAALTPTSPLIDLPPDAPDPPWLELLKPAWSEPKPDPYRALCVDGGAMNNEPLDLVRRVLAGWGGRNPRAPKEARRATVLIDPFVNRGKSGPTTPTGLIGTILPLFSALMANSRFKPEDLALAADPDVASRFLIAPSRGKDWLGEGAIAAGHLGGFLGFFSQDYREHDYFLGRRNARNFLRWVFVLPESNPLFGDRWSEADRKLWGVDRPEQASSTERHLPIIPLCGDLLERREEMPSWPAGKFSAETIRPAIEGRLKAVTPGLLDAMLKPKPGDKPKPNAGWSWPWLNRNVASGAVWLLRPRLVDAAMEQVTDAVERLDAGQHRGAASE